MLEVDGVAILQSNAILRFVAREFGMCTFISQYFINTYIFITPSQISSLHKTSFSTILYNYHSSCMLIWHMISPRKGTALHNFLKNCYLTTHGEVLHAALFVRVVWHVIVVNITRLVDQSEDK